ncbi:MAG: hypothetical protein GY753_15340 [Gammaproteobacteria bacterium]|nr:hypothetical protein [Gammaproteobacteria bacterium]
MDIKRYSQLYLRLIQLIQGFSHEYKAVHLVFSPIGTNALFLANQVFLNSQRGVKTVITQGVYDFDVAYIRDFNRAHSTNHQPTPWVLQRYDNYHSHERPWEIWFKNINFNEVICNDFAAEKASIESDLKGIRGDKDMRILEHAICLGYVTRFNKETKRFLEAYNYVGSSKCVAVHIRRGDACRADLSKADPNRDHHHVDRYLKQIDLFYDQGYRDFFILTESQEDIESLQRAVKKDCRIHFHEIDRRQFIEIQKSEYDPENFVEYRCLTDPDFAKITMESALIDIYNARQCEAFVGTFSSQFSVLAYLNVVAERKEIVPGVNFSECSYDRHFFEATNSVGPFRYVWRKLKAAKRRNSPKQSRKRAITRARIDNCLRLAEKELDDRFAEYARRTRKKALLIIKERDVGFFSLFLQIVNVLICVKSQGLDCDLVVDFGDKQSYFTGGNTWLDYFEPLPLVARSPVAATDIERVHAHHGSHLTHMPYWDTYGIVYKVADGLFWTGSYYPKFTEKCSAMHINHRWLPSRPEREEAASVIREKIQLNPEVRQERDAFVAQHFAGKSVVGVQFRGTDAREDGRRVIPSYDSYLDMIKRELGDLDGETVIFVASDESSFVEEMKRSFDSVVAIDTIRHDPSDQGVTGRGAAGWRMPSFIEKGKQPALKGAIMDYLLLSECDVMIHNLGSLTTAVLLGNPKMKTILIGEQLKW